MLFVTFLGKLSFLLVSAQRIKLHLFQVIIVHFFSLLIFVLKIILVFKNLYFYVFILFQLDSFSLYLIV